MPKPEPRWWQLSALDPESRLLWGYFLGVAIGATAFLVIVFLLSLPLHPAPALGSEFAGPPLAGIVTLGIVVLLMWVYAAWWVALPPFLLVRTVARRLKIRGVLYHLCGGAFSGGLLGCLYQRVGASLGAVEPSPPGEFSDATTLAIFCVAGAIGAFVYWWIAIRPDRSSGRFTG